MVNVALTPHAWAQAGGAKAHDHHAHQGAIDGAKARDHRAHQGGAKAHDHHAQQGEKSGAKASDPHAHHRAMMQEPSATKRSVTKYSVPSLTMVDQRGQKVSLTQLLDTDKPVMLNFIFTTCTAICPAMTSIFQQVQTSLGDDANKVLMVSVSIDPEEDTPTALAEYAQRFGAGPQWHFLTGSLEDSIAVQKAFAAYRGDKSNHAPLTLLRPKKGNEWVRLDGFASSSRLEKECRSML